MRRRTKENTNKQTDEYTDRKLQQGTVAKLPNTLIF